MCCIAAAAAPGTSQELSLELPVLQDKTQLSPWRAQAGPRHPVCTGIPWKFALTHLEGPVLRLAEQLLSEGFAYMENPLEEFIHSIKRKLAGAMSHILSTLWKFQSIQLLVMYIFVQALQNIYQDTCQQILVYVKWDYMWYLVNLLCNPKSLNENERPVFIILVQNLAEVYCWNRPTWNDTDIEIRYQNPSLLIKIRRFWMIYLSTLASATIPSVF